MSLTTPEKVQKLQQALHAKAKGSPDYRFYLLYDKVYRRDILSHAYHLCRANRGAAGVDGQRFEDIADYGENRWLDDLTEDLKAKTYRSQAVKRVYIPKANGKQRPLGIPTIRDRVAQTAVVLVLEPIFEADLQPEQYAYRRDRDALGAIGHIHKLVNTGYTDIVDADLSGYFDSIPHAELMKSVARRVSDRHLLHLIKQWLVMPVEETDGRGGRRRTTPNKDSKRGVPQGAPLSPLLANLYMRRFILGWKTQGHDRRLNAHIVNYADDFVICCRGTADQAMETMRTLMGRLKLTVNEEKTHSCHLPAERFDFLGYTIGRCHSKKTGRAYIGTRPSKKSIQTLCQTVSDLTTRRSLPREAEQLVGQLNRRLNGWANYFRLGPVSPAYRAIDAHTTHRLRQWLRKKHKQTSRGTTRYPDEYLYDVLRLTCLPQRTRRFPWANA